MLTDKEIGQLFMFGFCGKSFGPNLSSWLRDLLPGGVILFSRNAGEPEEVAALIHAMQAEAQAQGFGPLLCAVDQEGGTVARLTDGFTVFPSNMAFGAIHAREPVLALKLMARAAEVTGTELVSCGVNMNLAPCLDVNSNPLNPVVGVRSYSSHADVVAALGAACIMGYEKTGMIATAKHFPGHGDAEVDSHTGLPVIEWDPVFEETHVLPFRVAIDARVPAIMTAHILFKKGRERLWRNGFHSSGGVPATLSRDILVGYLRGSLGFRGLIITDCLEMAAISRIYGTAQAAVMALKAGADMVLISHDYDFQRQAVDAVRQAYERGELDEREIRAKLRRITALKSRLKQHVPGQLDSAGEGQQNHPRQPQDTKPPVTAGLVPSQELAATIAKMSITLLRKRFVPEPGYGKPALIAPRNFGSTRVEDIVATQLGMLLSERVGSFDHSLYSQEPTSDELEDCIETAARAGWVIFVANGLHLSAKRATLARRVMEANARFVLLSAGPPYDTLALPDAPYVVLSYGYAPVQLAAAFDVILGKEAPGGCLPVDVPGQFRYGFGLDVEGG